MTTTTSTSTPSIQILEAAEKAQALADAGMALKPFFSPEIQETVDGVDKIANALNATGQAMRHFGFDEDESYSSDFTSGQQQGDPLNEYQRPQFDLSDDLITGGAIATGAGGVAIATGAGAPIGVPTVIGGVASTAAGYFLKAFGFDEDESYSSDFTSEPQVIGEAGFDTGYIFDPNQEANQAVTGSIVSALDPQLDPSQAGVLA